MDEQQQQGLDWTLVEADVSEVVANYRGALGTWDVSIAWWDRTNEIERGVRHERVAASGPTFTAALTAALAAKAQFRGRGRGR